MKCILRPFPILFLVIIIFSSCGIFIEGYNEYKSAKNFHKERNYHQAALYASRSLKLKAKNKKALTLFENSFQLAVEEHRSNIMSLETIEDDSKWPRLYYEYDELQNLSDALVSLKPIIKVALRYDLDFPLQDHNEELNRIGPLAEEYNYNRRLEYRKEKNKESQKSAANYKNSKELYDETRAAALITLLILPFEGDYNLVDYIRNRMMMTQSNSQCFLDDYL